MANCTTCPNQREIDRIRSVCLACSIGGEACGVSHAGRSFVSLDAAGDPAKVYVSRAAPLSRAGGRADAPALDTPCSPEERERHLRLLRMFAALSWDDAGLVCALLRGETVGAIARARGVAYETVFLRWQKVKRANPAFAALANGFMGSGRGRKPKRRREVQGDLFGGR